MLLPGDVKPYSLSRSCQESKLPVWRCADMPSYHPYVINTDTKKCWWRRWRFLQWIMFCWRGERLRQSCRTTQTAAEAEAWNQWQYTASRWTASVMHIFTRCTGCFRKNDPVVYCQYFCNIWDLISNVCWSKPNIYQLVFKRVPLIIWKIMQFFLL